mgnify:CR=1 FL=1
MSNGDSQKIDFTVGDRVLSQKTKDQVEQVIYKLDQLAALLRAHIDQHEIERARIHARFKDCVKKSTIASTIKYTSLILGIIGAGGAAWAVIF